MIYIGMVKSIEIIKDSFGSCYLGIDIEEKEISPYLEYLKLYLDVEYDTYVNNQKRRDSDKYHLTVALPTEYKEMMDRVDVSKFSSDLESVLNFKIDDLVFKGIGRAEKFGNIAYYIVCESRKLDNVRTFMKLNEKDFHITLGFKNRDVYGVRKNEVMNLSLLLPKLRIEYYKGGESFEFLKGLKDFSFDFFKLIEPIKINDGISVFRCGDIDYFSVIIKDDTTLKIGEKWQSVDKIPTMSENLVRKRLKRTNI